MGGHPCGLPALLEASLFSAEYDIDWLWDALPECYLRIGPEAIPALKSFIAEDREAQQVTVLNEITGLWNIWTACPETRREIEDFFLEIIKSPGENYELRTELIADFALIKRRDLRELFEDYYERGEVDLNTLSRSDLDDFYADGQEGSQVGYRYDLEAFYDPAEVAKRQQRWAAEYEKEQQAELEEWILENLSRIGRNESCPCDSGLKFKKCHLPWAEEEMNRRRTRRLMEEESERMGQLIQDELYFETLLRRRLAARGKAALFAGLKEKTLEAIKLPHREYRKQRGLSYVSALLDQVGFADQDELNEFMADYQEYHNALAGQYIGHPRSSQKLH
jgi:uncharacterized protein YchJ